MRPAIVTSASALTPVLLARQHPEGAGRLARLQLLHGLVQVRDDRAEVGGLGRRVGADQRVQPHDPRPRGGGAGRSGPQPPPPRRSPRPAAAPHPPPARRYTCSAADGTTTSAIMPPPAASAAAAS